MRIFSRKTPKNGYVSSWFVAYRENKSPLERKLEKCWGITCSRGFSRDLNSKNMFISVNRYLNWNARIMSRQRWLWTLVLAVIARWAKCSNSIIIVNNECSRKFFFAKINQCAQRKCIEISLCSVLQKTPLRQEEFGTACQTRHRVRQNRRLPSRLWLREAFRLRRFQLQVMNFHRNNSQRNV